MGVDIEAWYARYAPMVHRRCRALLRDDEEAAEAMQDVFVECFKPGGALVYVTCSMLACENESRVTAFLENMPDFAPAPLDGLTEAMCENAHLVAPDRSMISFTPLKSGTDGFFVAKLAKKTA